MQVGIIKKIKQKLSSASFRFRRWLVRDVFTLDYQAQKFFLCEFIAKEIKKERRLRNEQNKRFMKSQAKVTRGIEIEINNRIDEDLKQLMRKIDVALSSLSSRISEHGESIYQAKSDIENLQSVIDHHHYLIEQIQGLDKEIKDNGSREKVPRRITAN